VLPIENDPDVVQRFFEVMTSSGSASFLTVVKDCGAEGKGMLSFPKPGISIALDLPMHPEKTQATTDALNEIVVAAGGRIYLTKDALTRPDHFRAMEPRLDAWNAVRRKWDPDGKIRSALSVRLLGDEE
jgi:FAD/FMN-containing dehydrogenase